MGYIGGFYILIFFPFSFQNTTSHFYFFSLFPFFPSLSPLPFSFSPPLSLTFSFKFKRSPFICVDEIINEGLRPIIPESTLPDFAELTRRCWSHDPLLRPNFSQIVAQLVGMIDPLQGFLFFFCFLLFLFFVFFCFFFCFFCCFFFFFFCFLFFCFCFVCFVVCFALFAV